MIVQGGVKHSGEVSVWTVSTIEFNPFAVGKEKELQEKIIELNRNSDGFIGVMPVFGKGTLFLYDTPENATSVRKKMLDDQFPVGENVVEVFINEDDFREAFGKADGEA